ncbi:unnamed protein product [Aphanomyces euteiches]
MSTHDVLVLIVSLTGNAIALLDDEIESSDDSKPEQRLIRPHAAFMDFLDLQQALDHGGDPLYYDNFRIPKPAIDLLVELCVSKVTQRMDPHTVVLVTLQYLATGSTVRLQEQIFQRQSFGHLGIYRRIGLKAILNGLVKNGFYAHAAHDEDHVRASSAAFYSQHPLLGKCLGAIDGTHIPLVVAADMVDRFRNRKGETSTSVMGVVDELGRFLAVYAGAEGKSF